MLDPEKYLASSDISKHDRKNKGSLKMIVLSASLDNLLKKEFRYDH